MYVSSYKFLATWIPKEKRYEVESVMDSVHFDDAELAHVYYNTMCDELCPVWEYEDDNLQTPVAGYDPYNLSFVYLFMHKQKTVNEMIAWKRVFDKKIAAKCIEESMDNDRNLVIYMRNVQCALDYVDRCIANASFDHSYGLPAQDTNRRNVTSGSYVSYKIVINELDGNKLTEDQIQTVDSLHIAKDAFDIASDDADTVIRIFGVAADGNEVQLFENNTELLEKYQKEEPVEETQQIVEEQSVVVEEQPEESVVASSESNEPEFDSWFIRYNHPVHGRRNKMFYDVKEARSAYAMIANKGYPVDIIGFKNKKAIRKLCEHNKPSTDPVAAEKQPGIASEKDIEEQPKKENIDVSEYHGRWNYENLMYYSKKDGMFHVQSYEKESEFRHDFDLLEQAKIPFIAKKHWNNMGSGGTRIWRSNKEFDYDFDYGHEIDPEFAPEIIRKMIDEEVKDYNNDVENDYESYGGKRELMYEVWEADDFYTLRVDCGEDGFENEVVFWTFVTKNGKSIVYF